MSVFSKTERMTVCFSMLVTACYSQSQLAAASSGSVGCAPDEIQIADESLAFDPQSWTARCGGKTFHCARPNAGAPTQCAERKAAP